MATMISRESFSGTVPMPDVVYHGFKNNGHLYKDKWGEKWYKLYQSGNVWVKEVYEGGCPCQ